MNRRPSDTVPLTYTQEARWNDFQLIGMKYNSRTCAVAKRLSGRLDRDALRRSLDALVCRHEALRTTVTVRQGNPQQQVRENASSVLDIVDLTRTPPSAVEKESRTLVEEFVSEPVDMAVGPLFGSRLFSLADDQHVLVIAADHMVADGMSMRLLLRDVFTAYGQLVRGQKISLPEVKAQLADFAVWQRKQQAAWIAEHGGYWKERLRAVGPAAAMRRDAGDSVACGWAKYDFRLPPDLRAAACENAAMHKTTLAMALFSAYSAVLMHHFERTDIVLGILTAGRPHAELANTVGFFAFTLHLRIELQPADTFIDLLRRVLTEYRVALEHQDLGFVSTPGNGLLPERPPTFTWLPGGSPRASPYAGGSTGGKASIGDVDVQPFLFSKGWAELQAHGEELTLHGGQPWLRLVDTGHEIWGTIRYRPSRFGGEEIARLAQALRVFAGNWIERPRAPLSHSWSS